MLRIVIGVATLVVGVACSFVSLVVGVVLATSLIAIPAAIFSVGIAAAALSMALLAYLAAKLLNRRRPGWFALMSAVLLVCTIAGTALVLLQPSPTEPRTDLQTLAPKAVEFWELDTGSRVAVKIVPGRRDIEATPVVFLHGGPGGYSVSLDATVAALSSLTDDGHNLYFYDQVGGGLSMRLTDITEYTLDRHLFDLNAIVRRIGKRQVILVGSSFGSSLAANYMARYPDNVAAAVMSGSAPMFYPYYADTGDGKIDDVLTSERRARIREIVETPRVFVALMLAAINPNAAARFAPDSELGGIFDRVANEVYLPATVCSGNEVAFRSDGFGFWSNRMTGRTLINQTYDPRPLLSTNTTPILVIRGSCDYKKERVAKEYIEVFQNARFIAMPHAGHMPYLEQPAAYIQHVRRFLKEQRLLGSR